MNTFYIILCVFDNLHRNSLYVFAFVCQFFCVGSWSQAVSDPYSQAACLAICICLLFVRIGSAEDYSESYEWTLIWFY